jgi:hypothetical protein
VAGDLARQRFLVGGDLLVLPLQAAKGSSPVLEGFGKERGIVSQLQANQKV